MYSCSALEDFSSLFAKNIEKAIRCNVLICTGFVDYAHQIASFRKQYADMNGYKIRHICLVHQMRYIIYYVLILARVNPRMWSSYGSNPDKFWYNGRFLVNSSGNFTLSPSIYLSLDTSKKGCRSDLNLYSIFNFIDESLYIWDIIALTLVNDSICTNIKARLQREFWPGCSVQTIADPDPSFVTIRIRTLQGRGFSFFCTVCPRVLDPFCTVSY